MNNQILVILVTYNVGNKLLTCLDSITNQTNQHYQVLIIDNNSIDDTTSVIKKYLNNHPELKRKTTIIRNTQNLGFAKAVNIGLTKSLHMKEIDTVLLLNQDVQFDNNLFEEACIAFQNHPEAGAVESIILYEDKAIWWVGTRLLSNKELLFSPKVGIAEHINKGKKYEGKQIKGKTVEALTGCAMFIRKKAIQETGFFNEKYFMYAEDIDYSLRLRSNGYQLILFTTSTVYHHANDRSISVKVIPTRLRKYSIYLSSMAKYLLDYKTFFIFGCWICKIPYALTYSYFSKKLLQNR